MRLVLAINAWHKICRLLVRMKPVAYIFFIIFLCGTVSAKPVKKTSYAFRENAKFFGKGDEWTRRIDHELKRGRLIYSPWGGYPDFKTWYLSRPWVT